MDIVPQQQEYGPWNPGLRSPVPSELRHLSTLLRIENVFTPLSMVDELASFSGLHPEEIVKLRPERLIVHELLVRVMADFSIPDGTKEQDLGINFRKIVRTIFENYIEPELGEIILAYNGLDKRMNSKINDELLTSMFHSQAFKNLQNPKNIPRWLQFGRKKFKHPSHQLNRETEDKKVLQSWQQKKNEADQFETQVMYQTLISVVNSIRGVHGQIRGDISLMTTLVNNITCNICGTSLVGEIIEPLMEKAIKVEGFRILPVQEMPIIMNTKGASASGKSTLRPLQKKLVKKLGVKWSNFALISPDIWRKYLLDFDSLGEDYKYAGPLTSDEITLIDQKLDTYMARKGEEGRMSHLLIDRFRFDSFAPASDDLAGSTLLTRFGKKVYLFFIITPPEETVERAWKRGQEVGRYKSVDDLLHHNLEAFTGMPRLFFTWALKTDKYVHYEFLDNDVPLGQRPKTVAFGINGTMTILDIKKMVDVERYKKINLSGRSPKEVYPDGKRMYAGRNIGFLQECTKLIPSITFADQATGRIYGTLYNGKINWTDSEVLESIIQDEDTKTSLEVFTGSVPKTNSAKIQSIDATRVSTLGQWAGESLINAINSNLSSPSKDKK